MEGGGPGRRNGEGCGECEDNDCEEEDEGDGGASSKDLENVDEVDADGIADFERR